MIWYSRSTLWAVLDNSFPGGFFRSTNFRPALSVSRYVGFDWPKPNYRVSFSCADLHFDKSTKHTCLTSIGVEIWGTFSRTYASSRATSMGCLTAPAMTETLELQKSRGAETHRARCGLGRGSSVCRKIESVRASPTATALGPAVGTRAVNAPGALSSHARGPGPGRRHALVSAVDAVTGPRSAHAAKPAPAIRRGCRDSTGKRKKSRGVAARFFLEAFLFRVFATPSHSLAVSLRLSSCPNPRLPSIWVPL
jgi:hypothetical protein